MGTGLALWDVPSFLHGAGGPAPTPLAQGRPCAHPFSLALAGECGKLRSCEMCTGSHPHNGTECVWVGCGTPEEPGEGLGWVGTGRGSPQPPALSVARGRARMVSASHPGVPSPSCSH